MGLNGSALPALVGIDGASAALQHIGLDVNLAENVAAIAVVRDDLSQSQ